MTDTGKKWISLVVISFFLLGAAFFFFLGSVFQLFGEGEYPHKGNVAIVEILGTIVDAKPVTKELAKLKKDKSVKAIVLRVDSPGGSVGASQEIFETVKAVKKVKPVVASMGTVAASGGYYVSAPASKIIANAGTITASIGVRMELVNLEEFLDWARVKAFTLKSGRLKDAGSPTRALTPEEKEYLESILKAMHQQFKKAIADSRGIPLEELETIADGRVLTGEEALNHKLVDELGALDRAVAVAGELAKLTEEPEPFYPEREKDGLIKYLMEGATEKIFESLAGSRFQNIQFLY